MIFMNWLKSLLDKSHIIVPTLFLAITASYCTYPLFINQTLPLAQDIVFHIFQADQFSSSLQSGILYPRWISDANNGYGSPTFIFYAPMSYYFASLLNFLVPSLITSMIIAIWSSFFLSGLTMFIALRSMFGSQSSLLSAVLYQIFPYHLINLYMRGTFAELFAFIWFPLILMFVHKIFYTNDNKAARAGLSLSYAGLILTHLVSGFIFSFVAGAYLLYNFLALKYKKSFLMAISSLLLGLGLSSFYLIPVIFERTLVQIEYIVNYFAGDYKRNFLFTPDKFQPELLNFYLVLHAGVVIVSVLFLLVAFKNRPTIHKQWHFFIFLFLTAFFLTTPLSRPIWDMTPGFENLQFPWRWVPVMELSLCFLICSVFSFKDGIAFKKDRLIRLIAYSIISIFILSFVIVFRSKPLPEKFMNKIADPLQFQSIMDPVIEYAPIWATRLDEVLAEKEMDRVSIISGKAMSQIIEWKPEERTISLKASEPSLLRISTFYFPGWEAKIDGKQTEIDIETNSGAMLINIPKGSHILELRFADTPIRRYSVIVSALSLLIIVFSAILPKNIYWNNNVSVKNK